MLLFKFDNNGTSMVNDMLYKKLIIQQFNSNSRYKKFHLKFGHQYIFEITHFQIFVLDKIASVTKIHKGIVLICDSAQIKAKSQKSTQH